MHEDENMNDFEIVKDAINDFDEIQEYMLLARTENAVNTYNRLKIKYNSLKTLLTTLGVNLTIIDRIDEY